MTTKNNTTTGMVLFYEKPSVANKMIKKPSEAIAKKLKDLRARRNEVADFIKDGKFLDHSGKSYHQILTEVKADIAKTLMSGKVTLTKKGQDMAKWCEARGFDLGITHGVHYHQTVALATDLSDKAKQYSDFCESEEGQQYQKAITEEHQKNGRYVRTRHGVSSKGGEVILRTTQTLETSISSSDKLASGVNSLAFIES